MRINEHGKVEFAENQALKALVDGASWNGGAHRWSLPTQAEDGSWTPGEWTPRRPVSMTPSGHEDGVPITGWYLTRDLVEWWHRGKQRATDAYLAEWRGPAVQSGDKIGVEECRLLRLLADAELATLGVYRSGHHVTITSGKVWIGGSAAVNGVTGLARVSCITDSACVERVTGSARVGIINGSARVACVADSARVERVAGSARVGSIFGAARVGGISDSARVESVYDFASVGCVGGSSRVESISGSARVENVQANASVGSIFGFASMEQIRGLARLGRVGGYARLERVHDSASVGSVYDSANVERVDDYASVDHVYGSGRVGSVEGFASVHAEGSSAVTVTAGSPKVTREGEAVIIDRRGSGPPKVYAKRGGIDSWRYRDGKQVPVKIRAKGGAR